MITNLSPSRSGRLCLAAAALAATLTGVAEILPTPAFAAEEVFASVGTGLLNGIYYPVGRAICQIVNQDISTNGVLCSAESTPGSVYNISAIRSGELEVWWQAPSSSSMRAS